MREGGLASASKRLLNCCKEYPNTRTGLSTNDVLISMDYRSYINGDVHAHFLITLLDATHQIFFPSTPQALSGSPNVN